MANKSKIVGELEQTVRSMCEKGYNVTHISKHIGVARGTVGLWAEKNGFVLPKKLSNKIIDLEPKIIAMLKEGKSRKEIQKALDIHFTQVTKIANDHNMTHLLRSRTISAIEDKTLSLEEAQKRVPKGHGKVIGFNKESSKYIIQANDGFIYYKKSPKIKQGDPRNKTGTKLTIENVCDQLKKLGYEYLDGWTIKRESLRAKHLKCGQIRENRLKNFYFQDCGTCSNKGTSKAELELLEWVKQYYPSAYKYKFQERVTRPKEIDIYIPELKIGIEYCGLHFHSEDIQDSSQNKHYKKMLSAQREGIRLITIFENEWLGRKDQVKGFLLSTLKKNQATIYARNCEVAEIDSEHANDFMEQYHIQGASSTNAICIGLFYEKELVGVMSAGMHPQRSKKDDILYLNRMAFKSNVSVVGGASRLLSHLKDFAKSHGYSKIVSWSDNRWSEGSVYKALNFRFDSQRDKGRGLSDGSIWPEFYYVINGELHTRKAVKKLMLDQDMLPKVYDCGKKRWVFEIK